MRGHTGGGCGGSLHTDPVLPQEVTLCSDPSLGCRPAQVVKAFVVLAPQFRSRDPDQLTRELQQHVKSVTAPYKYPRKVSTGLPTSRKGTRVYFQSSARL